MTLLYRLLLAIALATLVIILFFFQEGLTDGSVSGDNLLLWLALLTGAAVPIAAALRFRSRGQPAIACILLLVPAVPALLATLFFLVLVLNPPRWN